MNGRTVLCVAVAICLAVAGSLAWTAAASAADDVTAVIPNDALGFVVVNDLAASNEKIAKLAKLMELPAPNVLQLMKLSAKITKGLDEKGSVALAALPGGEGSVPKPVIFIPTNDYKALIEQLEPDDATADVTKIKLADESAVVGKKGNFAVLMQPSDDESLKKVLASKKSVADEIVPLKNYLAGADLAAVATPGGIKLAQKEILKGLAQAKADFAEAGEGMEMAASAIGVYETMFKALGDEVTHVVVALRVQDDGTVHVGSQSLFRPGG